MNLIDVTKSLGTEDQCLDFLERMHWPNGIRCLACESEKISTITRTVDPTKKRSEKKQNKRTRLYACLECGKRFTSTAGSVFHGSHLPLTTWFMAIAIVMDAKKGMSALQLKQHLGIGSYRTAWYMVHRIRKAMVELFPTKMKGVVEIDETYIGGKSIRRGNRRDGRTTWRDKKDTVIGMRERGGRVRFFHVADTKLETMKKIFDRHISSETKRIMTDSAVVYDFAMDKDFQRVHRMVNHSKEWVKYGDINVHTNTVESAFSLLKRGLIGSFHRVSIKHLHRYLAEFEHRFNARKDENRFEQMVRRMLSTEGIEYKQLTADPA
ncbi:MAG TPA: IS1595 family transposase [Candidatus Sulfotelmatobacter sp.]